MSQHLSALLALGLAGLAPAPSPAAPFTATEMMKLRRLADPQVSPDGSRVAFALTEVDLEGGKRNTDLWLVPVAGGSRGGSRRAPPRTHARGGARTGRGSPSSPRATALRRCGRSTSPGASRASSPRSRPARTVSSGSTRNACSCSPRSSRTVAPTTRATPRRWPGRASLPRRAPTTTSSSATGTPGTTGGATTSSWCRSKAEPRSTSPRAVTTHRRSASGARTGPCRRTDRRPASRARTGRTRPGARMPTCSSCPPPAARRGASRTRRATTAAAATARTAASSPGARSGGPATRPTAGGWW